MSTADDRPLILLDVDGNILTFVDSGNDFSDPRVPWAQHPDLGRYNPAVPGWIRELHTLAELRWLTSWNTDARTRLAPGLGLPDFAVEESRWFTDPTTDFKVQAVMQHLNAGRRVVWIDDEIPQTGDYDRLFYLGEAGAGLFMVRPTLGDGLTEAHMMRIRSFLAG